MLNAKFALINGKPTAHALLHGYGCPECGKVKAIKTKKWNVTQEKFLSKIPIDFIGKIDVLGTYSSQYDKIKVKCKECQRIWESTPWRLYRKQGCVICKRKEKGVKSRKSHEEYLQDINKIYYGSIYLIGKYTKGNDFIEVKCLQCNYIWNPIAQRLLRRGCPYCISSKGEKKIENILINSKVQHTRQYTFPDLKKFRFDFAVFKDDGELSHLIEYDGLQHFKPIKKWGGLDRFIRQKEIDKIKDDYCKNKGIKLVRIAYCMITKTLI